MELYARNREEWHEWLEKNHSDLNGIWLIYYKKSSGKPRVSYDDAVEEALCFGWIDGKIRRLDEERYMQWYTPRRKGSLWSQLNLKRVEKLISEGRMRSDGLAVYENRLKKTDRNYDRKDNKHLNLPDDLLAALKSEPNAFDNFMGFPVSNRKLYILWLNSAKRPETRSSRIIRIVQNSLKKIKAGMM